MSARRHERTRARRAALQVLYSGEITEAAPTSVIDRGTLLDEEGAFGDYARRLVEGVEEHLDVIDGCLVDASENWALARMPIVDRSLLRLATFEMMYVDEVPLSVSINEAVELAKEFGGEDESPRFVNGVLGRIAQRIEAGRAAVEGSLTGSDDPEAASVESSVSEGSEDGAGDAR